MLSLHLFYACAVAVQVVSPEDGEVFRVNETSNITFSCVATGLPSPTITFLNGDQPLGPPRFIAETLSSVLLPNTRFQVTTTLTLINAMDEDSGGVCQAVNSVEELNETRMDQVNIVLVVNGECLCIAIMCVYRLCVYLHILYKYCCLFHYFHLLN